MKILKIWKFKMILLNATEIINIYKSEQYIVNNSIYIPTYILTSFSLFS